MLRYAGIGKIPGNCWLTAAKKPVKNRDLWEQLTILLKHHPVRFHWLKGHAGHPEKAVRAEKGGA